MVGELLDADFVEAGFRGDYPILTTAEERLFWWRILLKPVASFLLAFFFFTVAIHLRDAPVKGVCVVVGRERWATFVANVRQELQRMIGREDGALSHGHGGGRFNCRLSRVSSNVALLSS